MTGRTIASRGVMLVSWLYTDALNSAASNTPWIDASVSSHAVEASSLCVCCSFSMLTLHDALTDLHKQTDELRNEITVMSQLNHPNICRLLEIYESPARYVFAENFPGCNM